MEELNATSFTTQINNDNCYNATNDKIKNEKNGGEMFGRVSEMGSRNVLQ